MLDKYQYLYDEITHRAIVGDINRERRNDININSRVAALQRQILLRGIYYREIFLNIIP